MKIKRTDEQWQHVLTIRAERLVKLVSFKAPMVVIAQECWLVWRALHKDSKCSMVRTVFHWIWVDILVIVTEFYQRRILRKDPNDESGDFEK